MCDHKWLIERECPRTGFKETWVYTGRKRDKPIGWKIVKRVE